MESLTEIEKCLFIICLDPSTQNPTDQEISQKDMFKQMLTGKGTRYNGYNRWFDKTIQLIFSPNGVNGMCYEHTASEGVAVVTALLNIFKFIETLNVDEGKENLQNFDVAKLYKKLDFKVTDELKQRIMIAGNMK